MFKEQKKTKLRELDVEVGDEFETLKIMLLILWIARGVYSKKEGC